MKPTAPYLDTANFYNNNDNDIDNINNNINNNDTDEYLPNTNNIKSPYFNSNSNNNNNNNNNNYYGNQKTLVLPTPLKSIQVPNYTTSEWNNNNNHHYQHQHDVQYPLSTSVYSTSSDLLDAQQLNYQNKEITIPSECIIYSEFRVTPDQAMDAFKDWIDKMWFTPTGFKKQMDLNSLTKKFVPFYCFQIVYKVKYQGQVSYGHSNNCGNSSNHGNNANVNGYSRIEHGEIVKKKDKIMLLGCRGIVNDEEAAILANIGSHYDFNDTLKKPLSQFESESVFDHIELVTRNSADDVWESSKFIDRKINEIEMDKAQDYLREQLSLTDPTIKSTGCSVTAIDLESKRYMLYYLPFYYKTYRDQGHTYPIYISGQDAHMYSIRPGYGLGKLGDVFKHTRNLLSSTFGFREPISKFTGGDLATVDGTTTYDIDCRYLCWGRSTPKLLNSSGSVGWVKIKNTNKSMSYEITGQKRRGSFKSFPITMPPNSEKTFSYKGHWCFELKDVDSENWLKIESFSPEGGESFPSITNGKTK
eukprot:gene5620-6994_t